MRVVLLYTELAEYTIACLRELSTNESVEIHVVKWPVNKEAPFQFQMPQSISIYERDQFDEVKLLALVKSIQPSIIITSGWVDKGYLKVCKYFRKKIPTVLALDNHWRGDFKQIIASFLSPFLIRNKFSHAWVPGSKQKQYAQKLGFSNQRIKTGFYSADVDQFLKYRQLGRKTEQNVLLYVGRYVEHKGIFDLWKAFVEVSERNNGNWELWCIGTGDQYENRMIHPKIKHLGFVQPKDMGEYILKSTAYILPSHFEPWGVTVHEFAAAGLPILCSDKVGSAEAFVEHKKNGFIFQSGNIESIKLAMLTLFDKSEEEMSIMREHSVKLAMKITPKTWSETLMELANA